MKSTSFSRVVSSDENVIAAFDSCAWARLFWRAILWLHGKPTAPDLSDEARRHIVADGFHFYAMLYRFLAGLFVLTGALCWWGQVFETTNQALYGVGGSVLMGAFLLIASELGFCGVHALRQNRVAARLLLCGFMVSIIAFLSAFVATASVVFQWQTGNFAALNLIVAAAVWVFGIGSYGIEVLYLVTETRLEPAQQPL